MKSIGIFPLAIMLATTSMFGQSLTLPPRIDPSKCPVGLQVERTGGLFVYKNANSAPSDGVALPSSEQRFDFKMTNFSPRAIVNAEITVHGFSHKGRFMPASAPPPDLAKTVEVAFAVKENSSASRELSFAHFSAVKTMDVISVTYADGSTWHASSPGACSVSPSLLMLVQASQ